MSCFLFYIKAGNKKGKTCLSLRLVEDAVHCVQQSHLLVKVQHCLFGELSTRNTPDYKLNGAALNWIIKWTGCSRADCT